MLPLVGIGALVLGLLVGRSGRSRCIRTFPDPWVLPGYRWPSIPAPPLGPLTDSRMVYFVQPYAGCRRLDPFPVGEWRSDRDTTEARHAFERELDRMFRGFARVFREEHGLTEGVGGFQAIIPGPED